MPDRLLRPLLIVEFLIALQTFLACWAELAGRYHMELIDWGWKGGLSLAAAGLIVAITANLLQNDGAITRLGLTLCSFLIVVVVAAGLVTYYYHMNEPGPQEEEDPGEDRISLIVLPDATRPGMPFRREPSAALPYS